MALAHEQALRDPGYQSVRQSQTVQGEWGTIERERQVLTAISVRPHDRESVAR